MQSLSFILRLVAIAAAISSLLIYMSAHKNLTGKAKEVLLMERKSEAVINELNEAVITIQELEAQILNERSTLAETKLALSTGQAALQISKQKTSLLAEKLQRADQQIAGLNTEMANLRDKLLSAQRKESSEGQAQTIAALETSIDILNAENEKLKTLFASEQALRATIETPYKSQSLQQNQLFDPNYKTTTELKRALAEVASINNKTRILVVSATPALNLKLGHEIQIVALGKRLGKAKIFKITDSYIVASLLPDFNTERIDVGAIVTIIK
ncbi:MAG: Uncharacterised protein [Opitutia bacterium UBA7350]|nr:MAG: Uncharacterised protein [Opitutae bacterium UBA7350]